MAIVTTTKEVKYDYPALPGNRSDCTCDNTAVVASPYYRDQRNVPVYEWATNVNRP